jgi:hypothetical protein
MSGLKKKTQSQRKVKKKMVTLKEIKNKYPDNLVGQIDRKQLFRLYNRFLIIYFSYMAIIAEYDQLSGVLTINPTAFSRTTQRHKGIIKRLHPTATIKDMIL